MSHSTTTTAAAAARWIAKSASRRRRRTPPAIATTRRLLQSGNSHGRKRNGSTTRAVIVNNNTKTAAAGGKNTNANKIHYTTSNKPQQSATSWWHHEDPAAALLQQQQQVTISWPQAKSLFLVSAIPMVGFGFMDNIVMIQAGQYIDANLGQVLGLATLTAAALGQVFSDVAGVLFGSSLETALKPLLGRHANTATLSAAQRALPVVKYTQTAGAVVGVIVGCLLGASSLFFMDLKVRERQEKLEELTNILRDLQQEHSTSSQVTNAAGAAASAQNGTDAIASTRQKRLTCYMKEMQPGEEAQHAQHQQSTLIQPWIRAPLTAQQCAQDSETVIKELHSSELNASNDATTLVCTTPLWNETKDTVIGVLEFVATTRTLPTATDADDKTSELPPSDHALLRRKLHQQEAEITAQHISILWNRM